MQDAFGVSKGFKFPKLPSFRAKKPPAWSASSDESWGSLPKTPHKLRSWEQPKPKQAEMIQPPKQGSNTPAAQRAKALAQAKQDKRTPQVRNAWKTGRHVND